MSKQPAVGFTAEQMRAMIESKGVIDFIDDATRNYIVKKHAPDDNPHPHLTFLDDLLAEAKIAMRTLILSLNDDKILSIRLQRDFSNKDPNSFDITWGIELPSAEYNSYRTLSVTYIGHVRVGIRNSSAANSYTVYRIHQPGGSCHNLGLIISANVTHTHQIVPISREFDNDLGNSVKIATQRLFGLAADSKDIEQARTFEEIAEDVARQQEIESDCFTESAHAILDVAGVRELSDVLHLALTYGKTEER